MVPRPTAAASSTARFNLSNKRKNVQISDFFFARMMRQLCIRVCDNNKTTVVVSESARPRLFLNLIISWDPGFNDTLL